MRPQVLLLLAAALLVAAMMLWQDRVRLGVAPAAPGPAGPAPALNGEPRLMLWAWETPEDLRALDPARAGVAFLARSVVLGSRVTVRPRLQPLAVAPGTWMTAVVRVEATSAFVPGDALRREAVPAILDALARPGLRALQIDFDATASQRDFYATLLRDVRRALPPGFPLSITALASWCGERSWLTSLPSGPVPIDEAVPMYFRMGGPLKTRSGAARSLSAIAAPPCRGSVGISTDEVWPDIGPSTRVFLFRPGPWTERDIATLNRLGYVGVHGNLP